jgi:hypothetical protein
LFFKLVLASLLLFISPLGRGAFLSADQVEKISKHKQWHRLLHIRPTLLKTESRASVDTFFFAPDGRKNPRSELLATLAAFESNPETICRFPARAYFLSSYIPSLKPQLKSQCAEFIQWSEKLGEDRLSLVFAGAYPNNPASLFGHTLLTFSSAGRPPLLDYAVAFLAASNPDDTAIAYTIKGLAGGYEGMFNLDIFSMSVGLYNNSESRDLWIYELNTTQAERKMIIAHLWELMNHTSFTYYFVDENCSYLLLALLEVARPEAELSSQMSGFVMPLETVKLIQREWGEFLSVTHRLSVMDRIWQKWSALNTSEVEQIVKALKNPETIELAQLSRLSLEILIDWNHMRNYKAQTNLGPREQAFMREVLLERSRRGEGADFPYRLSPPEASPHLSHAPKRIAFHSTKNESSLEIGLGLHRLGDHPHGFENFAYIDFLNLKAAHNWNERKLTLERGEVVNITSLESLNFLHPSLSWRGSLSYESGTAQLSREHALLRAGVGVSKAYSFITGALFLTPRLTTETQKWRTTLAPAAEGLIIFQLSNRFTLVASGSVSLDPVQAWNEWQLLANTHLNLDFSVGLTLERDRLGGQLTYRY